MLKYVEQHFERRKAAFNRRQEIENEIEKRQARISSFVD